MYISQIFTGVDTVLYYTSTQCCSAIVPKYINNNNTIKIWQTYILAIYIWAKMHGRNSGLKCMAKQRVDLNITSPGRFSEFHHSFGFVVAGWTHHRYLTVPGTKRICFFSTLTYLTSNQPSFLIVLSRTRLLETWNLATNKTILTDQKWRRLCLYNQIILNHWYNIFVQVVPWVH